MKKKKKKEGPTGNLKLIHQSIPRHAVLEQESEEP